LEVGPYKLAYEAACRDYEEALRYAPPTYKGYFAHDRLLFWLRTVRSDLKHIVEAVERRNRRANKAKA
jgi:hypothetical protein